MSHFSKLLFLPLSVFLLIGTAIGFSSAGSENASPYEKITIENGKGKFSWKIDLASDQPSRSKGLMHRQSMIPQTGMLFRFEETRSVSMWMKNTFISLDMVFLDSAGRIKNIHRSAVPHSLEIINSKGPVRYVLEINAGEADSHGLQVGGQFRHPWFAVSE